MMRRLLAILLLPAASAMSAELKPAELEFFEKKVRPVLVERCYSCHSEEAKKLKGNLKLDTREGWAKGGDLGPAIVPGEPEKSALVRAVKYEDLDVAMPPKGKLPQAEVDVLVQWVKMGAPDPRTGAPAKSAEINLEDGRKHWAYRPLSHPIVPVVRDSDWPKNDIDRFIVTRIESDNLRPAADADPEALVRRLYFDLIGLPPTPEQLDKYLSDPSPDRYEKLVDALLASPHFGERWGRHWLDVARYAESLTLRGFVLKDAWRYRDYVIDSFNADRPFDQFMREQVAGDLLPAATPDDAKRQTIATAFLAIGNTNLEEQNKRQLDMDVVDEQLDTLGRAFLAQTIGCARCHDHKFDPIPTKDYYALAGILRSTQALEHANVSKWIEMPLPVDPAREEELKKHEQAVAFLQAKIKSLRATAENKPDAPARASTAAADLPGIVVDDAQAKRVGPWRESSHIKGYVGAGYLVNDGDPKAARTLTYEPDLTKPGKYEVRLSYTHGPSRASNVEVTVFSADGDKTVTVNQQLPPSIDGLFVSLGQYAFEKNGQGFVIVSGEGADGYVISDAVQFIPVDQALAPRPVATAKTPAPSQDVRQLEAELKRLTETGPKRDAIISVREREKPADVKIHVRGNVATQGEVAPRGFLQVVPVKHVPAIPKEKSGRRELGDWLADPQNPLPPRVMANRIWHWLMGEGLVRTPDNFGLTGEKPSHPELLDHLATRFVHDGWSVKKLVRQVVLSRTYRLSSRITQHAAQADPENHLFSHARRQRLEAEAIRDAILHVSGRLDPSRGGPTYKPNLSSDFSFKHADTRRSVYAPVFRNALPELFEAFDFADPSVGTGKRNVSTVAPQALFLMNHPFVKEQARHAAIRLVNETPEAARLTVAYRRTLARAPTADERAVADGFLKTPGLTPEDAWTQLFHALFASMDFRYVD